MTTSSSSVHRIPADYAAHMRLRRAPGAESVVLLEPDTAEADGLRAGLRPLGLAVIRVSDPLRAVARMNSAGVCAVLVTPSIDPHILVGLVKVFRSETTIPVLVAHAPNETDLIGPALLAGARPIAYPYHVGEIARVIDANLPQPPPPERITMGTLTVLPDSFEVRVRELTVDLSPLEFGLFFVLARRPGYSVTRQELITTLWADCRSNPKDLLNAAMGRIRKKFAHVGVPDVIETVRGVGYRLNSGAFATSL